MRQNASSHPCPGDSGPGSVEARRSAKISVGSHAPRIASLICARASCSAVTPSMTASILNCARPPRPSPSTVPGAGPFRRSIRYVVPFPVLPRWITVQLSSSPAGRRTPRESIARSPLGLGAPFIPETASSVSPSSAVFTSSAASNSVGQRASSARKLSSSLCVTRASSAGWSGGVL